MAMSFDTRFLIAKAQIAQGTAAVYSGSNLIPCLELDHRPLDGDRNSRDIIDGSPGTEAGDFLHRPKVRVTAAVEASAAMSSGDAPFWADLALACGLEAAVSAGVTYRIFPEVQQGAGNRVTLVGGFGGTQAVPGAAADWLQEAIDGSGKVSFEVRDGELPKLTFDMTAIYGVPVARDAIAALSPLDVGALSQATYREALPVSFANTSFSLAGQNLVLHELTMVDDTPVIHADRPNDLSTRRGRRSYSGRLVISAPSLASFDYFTRSLDGQKSLLDLGHGPVGSRFQLKANAVQTFLSGIDERDNEVRATFDLLYLRSDDVNAEIASEFRFVTS